MKRASHIKMTEREFRKRKRRECRELRQAIHKMRHGAAYLPLSALGQLRQVESAFEKMYKDCKEWWKKA